jgi:hypothetical protein
MTCTTKGALRDDWRGAPLLVWVEVAALRFWLEPVAVLDMLAGWS